MTIVIVVYTNIMQLLWYPLYNSSIVVCALYTVAYCGIIYKNSYMWYFIHIIFVYIKWYIYLLNSYQY